MSDRELAIRMAFGDRAALREAYERWATELLMFARTLTKGNVADAEDVLQQCFVRVWENRRQLVSVENLRAYFFIALRNVFLNLRRTESRETGRRTRLGEAMGLITEAPSDSEMDVGEVNRALDSLPADQRQVVVLKIWGELTFAEIADVLDAPPNTVASRYRYGLRRLRELLGDMS